ncbi:MAG: hypothetical protein CVV25_01615 [Ignavibacteriae bacterium HGW-Ignavibacteriae-4]|nr:MAG: hypothetical protein CVV25_01615 [Ignavibacteriae bacterium HGW-Ignavibacteriae-4]
MKKYFIHLSVILFTVILASCNWNPTDIGNDRGHNGGDNDTIVDFDSTHREIMILDMIINESFEFDNSKIIQLVSSASPDDSGRDYTVVLNLSKDNGISFTELVLTSANPTYQDNEIDITILNASPRFGAKIRIALI